MIPLSLVLCPARLRALWRHSASTSSWRQPPLRRALAHWVRPLEDTPIWPSRTPICHLASAARLGAKHSGGSPLQTDTVRRRYRHKDLYDSKANSQQHPEHVCIQLIGMLGGVPTRVPRSCQPHAVRATSAALLLCHHLAGRHHTPHTEKRKKVRHNRERSPQIVTTFARVCVAPLGSGGMP